MLYYHFAFTYLLAFNLYTEATRKNPHKVYKIVDREVVSFKKRARLIKSFLPPGIPSQEIWARVCRKAETLKELKTSVCEVGNVNLKYKRHLNEDTDNNHFSKQILNSST